MPQPTVPPVSSPPPETPDSSLSLDIVAIILRRRWYWILFCALLGGTAAYYMAATQNYVFEKTASVMMREASKDSSTDRIMVELGVDSGAANLTNESFILRSSTVMRHTVEDLKLNVSYWKKRDLRQIDLYRESPVEVIFENIPSDRSCSFDITLKGDSACP